MARQRQETGGWATILWIAWREGETDRRELLCRHHREHVDGDYKHPPPAGKYLALLDYSQSLMKRDPVRIQRDLLQFVLDMVVQRLLSRDNDVDIASQDPIHFHGLVRCYKNNPRIELGIAKQYATAQLKSAQLVTTDPHFSGLPGATVL